MAAFDYKGLSQAETADLVRLTHDLASFTQMDRIIGLPAGAIFGGLDDLLGAGALLGNPISLGLPAGWRVLGGDELGLEPWRSDADGYLILESPLTGRLPTGPQLQVMAQQDATGAVVRMAVVYAGTNSPVDVLDYLELNSGTALAAAIEPVLAAVADYARAHGLGGADVITTGYSLGAGMTNIQARFADTLAGGFFADSDYVGHAVPVIYDDPGRVLNLGFENDVVHRATGDAGDFWGAVAQADPLLANPDRSFATSTDNLVAFDGVYAGAPVTLAVDSLLNLAGWWAHVGGVLTDGLMRIADSPFYEFTHRDSVMVVSNLGADLRATTWVWDKPSPTSDHFGAPSFVFGTRYGDLLRDGAGNDWIDAGAGDDLIRVSSGLNRVDGGAGVDTLRVITDPGDLRVFRLADGTMAFETRDGLTIANAIEKVEIGQPGLFGLIDHTRPYDIGAQGLKDTSWSLLTFFNRDIRYGTATEGGAGDDLLAGGVVFGQGGDDRISGTAGHDLLHGGEGADHLSGGAGDDRLYGGEGGDRLVAGAGTDRLTGGHGDDEFVFDAAIRGHAIVEDFNMMAGEADLLVLTGGDGAAAMADAQQVGADVVIQHGLMQVTLVDTTLDALI